MSGTPQLEPSASDPPGRQGHFHTNVSVLRALGELEDNAPVFTNPFAPQNPQLTLARNSQFLGTAHDGYDASNAPSPATSHGPSNSPVVEEVRTNLKNSSRLNADNVDRGWPHRRTSPLPLPPLPPIYREFEAHPHLLIVETRQSNLGVRTPPRSRRPSSSSPMPYQHRHGPSPPHMEATEKPQGNHESVGSFDHLSYHSPNASPPEYFYGTHTYPQLRYPPSEGGSPPANLLSPLYGIDVASGQRHNEPIDLSAMYHSSDISNGNNSTLHSTYATPAEKTHLSISAAPAPGHGLSTHEQVHHQAPNSALGFTRSPGPAGAYDWHATYGAEPGYHQPPRYHTNDVRYDEEPRQLFVPGANGPAY
ncbi:hypothetical protein FRC07_012163 [Ceratobasidium sp. 392]|nr:hypothetical protein FRC07_012163 [Ceratobasidium sp. 392]